MATAFESRFAVQVLRRIEVETYWYQVSDNRLAKAPDFQAEVRQLLRDRVLDAARSMICVDGWGGVSMSRLAKEVGIGRQRQYQEIGTKEELVDALIEREPRIYLAGVATVLADHPADPLSGILAAVEYTLRAASNDPLVAAVLIGRREGEVALLPALVRDPGPVLGRAVISMSAAIRAGHRFGNLSESELDSAIEALVRLTPSHVFQPTSSVADAVRQIGDVARGVLRGH
ncbi:TetR/AcrR family transcriptional regulator [Nocardia sp. NPDC127606]|uniref:TetR/AcrR family transcriptional regulator n=1 Tax=Nocardia sp. NPDC127606 TaxID=3345406 RepID=UPI003643E85D